MLILTDTIINIELDKMPQPWRTATKLSWMYHPPWANILWHAAAAVDAAAKG